MKTFDNIEMFVFWGLMVTFLLDLVSTFAFVSKGYGNLEGNLIIRRLGWQSGLALVIVFNGLMIFLVTEVVQKLRRKAKSRFYWISPIAAFIFMRTVVIAYNFFAAFTYPKVASYTVEPVSAQAANTWGFMLVGAIIFGAIIANFTFYIFEKSYDIRYIGGKG